MARALHDVMMYLQTLVVHCQRCPLLLLVISYCVVLGIPLNTIIQTKQGKIRGFITNHRSHHRVNAYLGIPFAKPPINDLRFKHPVRADDWTGILNVTEPHNSCIQLLDTTFDYKTDFMGAKQWNANTKRSEDCLYLNVWAPHEQLPDRKRAVMVWIYGGGFVSGTATLDIYDGTVLAAEGDVIVVTFNYRVGSLGFIYFGQAEAPGNAGMHDQLRALDWVQNNIEAFGGDPNNVTLFGESAGSVSVSLHLLSQLSIVKFNRAILQSGVANLEWAVIPENEALSRSKTFARLLGCNQSSIADMVICLRVKNTSDLLHNEYHQDVIVGMWQFPFVPVIDGIFITETPIVSLRRGQFKRIPILMGTNLNEGSWLLPYNLGEYFSIEMPPPIDDKLFYQVVENITPYYPRFPYKINPLGSEAILFQYTPWRDRTNVDSNINAVQNVIGDYHMICGCTDFAQHYHMHRQKVFYYSFEHRSSKNDWPKWMGVMHGDEIHYVFGLPLRQRSHFHKTERELSRKMIKFWTNYAKTGNPNYGPGEEHKNEWPVYKVNELKYLILNSKIVRQTKRGRGIGHGPRINHCAFWREYLPDLVAATMDITKAELDWKRHFHLWQTSYIVDWRREFDSYVRNRQNRYQSQTCDGR